MDSEEIKKHSGKDSTKESHEFELTKEDHIIVLNMLHLELHDIETQIETSLTNNHVPLSQ